MRNAIVCVLFVLLLDSCVMVPQQSPLVAFHQARPRSILVVPVVNNSVDVMAGTSALTTLPKVLGERGYYVFPVNTVKSLLEFEGFVDAQEIHDAPTQSLASLFHADSVLYVTIHSWTSRYLVFSTTTEVDLGYVMTDSIGNTIFADRKMLEYTPQSESSGDLMSDLIASAITAAVERAAPNYLPLTRQANDLVFLYSSYPLPPGPYHPSYDKYYTEVEAEQTTGSTPPD